MCSSCVVTMLEPQNHAQVMLECNLYSSAKLIDTHAAFGVFSIVILAKQFVRSGAAVQGRLLGGLLGGL